MKLNIQYLVILKQLYENKIFNVNDILQEAVPNQPENAQDTGDEAKFEFTKLEFNRNLNYSCCQIFMLQFVNLQ